MQEVGRGRKQDEVWQSLGPFLVKGDELTVQYAFMERIEQLAQAALDRDHLKLRSFVQDVTREKVDWGNIQHPSTNDARLLVVSAALVELLAQRNHQLPPAWTKEIGALKEPFFLLESAIQMKRLRVLCETQSPEPMRKRLLYAPPHFLEFA